MSYLDEEKDMIPPYLEKKGIKVYNTSIQNYVENFNLKYDKVFCEQAVNYWLLHIDIEKFANIFNKDALFIFNTFINKPSEKPTIKQYTIDNVDFLEIS